MDPGFEFCILLSVEIHGRKLFYRAFGDKRIHDHCNNINDVSEVLLCNSLFFRRVSGCSARLVYLLLAVTGSEVL